MTTIAVIGAGWAGCAAAVELADAGHNVTMFEAARTLGGRARTIELDGRQLDNGQHILLGAYTETLRVLRKTGVDVEQALLRLPLQMRYPEGKDGMTFIASRLPAPLHLLTALFRAKGLTHDDKMALARFSTTARWMDWRLNDDCSVTTLLQRFDQPERLTRLMWRPLCIAALNTPPERASAQIFLNVLRDSFGARRSASDMLIPRSDLSTLFPLHAVRFVEKHNGKIRTGTAVQQLRRAENGWLLTTGAEESHFDSVVITTSATQAAELLAEVTARNLIPEFTYEAISTCYLQYPAGTRLTQPFFALVDNPLDNQSGQFVFDRGQLDVQQDGLFAVVISASTDVVAEGHAALSRNVAAQLAQAFDRPALAQPSWTRVITEKRATYACTPELKRPVEKTEFPDLVIAGDYMDGDYPATLESAVCSGVKAARLLSEHFATAIPPLQAP